MKNENLRNSKLFLNIITYSLIILIFIFKIVQNTSG